MPLPDDEYELRKQLKKENTYTQAVKDRVGEIVDKVNPFKSSTAETLRNRGKQIDAQTDGTNDPTRVEYGGNRGSSTGQ